MQKWWLDAVFYHIYPLGYLNAPAENGNDAERVHRIRGISGHINEIKRLGCNAIYFGPVFESLSHGYDTIDYEQIDRRLGDRESFSRLVETLHSEGIRVVLDGVFNHVGREFPPFLDLKQKKRNSPYIDWFLNVDFESDNGYGDGFTYHAWEGHDQLVSLNLQNNEVISYLFNAVSRMITELKIDGLRLDVAYLLDRDFLDALSTLCRALKEDFWLMGEMIHGDYRELICPGRLDSATNYECYKGLYSSHNDRNYFELAWSLNRQFGAEGIYREQHLYNFVDNHDVDRLASIIHDSRMIPLVYTLLFTMPGIPSIYYGSEWAVKGDKSSGSDSSLRPPIDGIPREDDSLVKHIANLTLLRRLHIALRLGDYRQLHVSNEQFVFQRTFNEDSTIVGLNLSDNPADLNFVAEGLYLEPRDWKLLAR